MKKYIAKVLSCWIECVRSAAPHPVPKVRMGFLALMCSMMALAVWIGGVNKVSAQAMPVDGQFNAVPINLTFEKNDNIDNIKDSYIAHATCLTVSLSKQEVLLQSNESGVSSRNALRIRFDHAQKNTVLLPESRINAVASHFQTRDTHRWSIGRPLFSRVRYRGLYRGVDLTFYGNDAHLEYDFTLTPGSNLSEVRMHFDGADDAQIDAKGDLIAHLNGREVRFRRPIAYQGDTANRRLVPAQYLLTKRDDDTVTVGFTAGPYDVTKTLIIDPVLEYVNYVGEGLEKVDGLAVDSTGSAYVLTGSGIGTLELRAYTADGSLARTATIASIYPDARLDGSAVAVSSAGLVYVVGSAAAGLPTTNNAAHIAIRDGVDAFIAVFENASRGLNLKYLSYLSEDSHSLAGYLTVDKDGIATIAGTVRGKKFPITHNALQSVVKESSASNAFIVKVDPTRAGAASVVYSSYFGSGTKIDGIAVDKLGSTYLLYNYDRAMALSIGASVVEEYAFGSEMQLSRIDPSGSSVAATVDLGAGYGTALAVDSIGAVYVAGVAVAPAPHATPGAYRADDSGGFVLKLDASTNKQRFLTYLGGTGVHPESISLPLGCNESCPIVIAGLNEAKSFPSIRGLQLDHTENPAAFAVKLASNGASAEYSTLVGGMHAQVLAEVSTEDGATQIAPPRAAVDGNGTVYLAGNLAAAVDGSAEYSVTRKGAMGGGFLAVMKDADQPLLVADPQQLQLGQAAIGNSSTAVNIMLRNVGTTAATHLIVQTSPAAEYTADTRSCGSQIEAGAACTVTVNFFPAAIGIRDGTLQVRSADNEVALSVPLIGTGLSAATMSGSESLAAHAMVSTAQVALSQSVLTYGNQYVGSATPILTSVLSNTGTAQVTIGSVAMSGTNAAQFAFISPAPKGACVASLVLAVGSSCTVTVKYTPILGAAAAAVNIIDSAGTQMLLLTGTGIAYPVPYITNIAPYQLLPGAAPTTLTINGANFTSGIAARWNSTVLSTTYVSASQMTAVVPASLLSSSGSAVLMAANLKPTSVLSNPAYAKIASPVPNIGFNGSIFSALSVNQPSALLTVDLNSDNKPDLVVLNALDGLAQIYLNAGSGRMALKNNISVGNGPVAATAADLNEDGKIDLAVLSASGLVTLFIGDGVGNFTSAGSIAGGSAGQSIVAGDMNGDGHIDLAVLNATNGTVTVFAGNGLTGFVSTSTSATGSAPYGMIALDANRDGVLDLLVGNADGSVTVLLGTGTGSFNTGPVVLSGVNTLAMVTGDFNEDGISDLALASANGNITLLNGDGSGSYIAASTIVTGSVITTLAVNDLNDDGHADLIGVGPGQNQAMVYYGNGKSIFTTGPVITTIAAPSQISVLDLDGNGYPDVVLASISKNNVQVQLQEPLVSISTTNISFGQQLINTPSAVRVFTVANIGTTPLVLSGLSISPASNTPSSDYALSSSCGILPVSLLSGNSCQVSITFTPSKAANESATLGISDTSGGVNSNQTIALSGSGVSSTATTASMSTPAIQYGSIAQVQVAMTGAAAIPTGSVMLTVSGVGTFYQTLNGGSATFILPALPAGSYALTLNYSAQGGFLASNAVGTLVVNPATTNVVVSAPVAYFGQPNQVAVTVASAIGIPPGLVSLAVDGTAIQSQTLSSGSASFSLTGLRAGTHSILATYIAQGNYAASSVTAQQSTAQAIPVLAWDTPVPILLGTPLSSTQLNATAQIPGSFAYMPDVGTKLGMGVDQPLRAFFMPEDAVDYAVSTVSTVITVYANPVAYLQSVLPLSLTQSATSGGAALALRGANFSSSSVAYWNGSALQTQLISVGNLSAVLPTGFVPSTDTSMIRVSNVAKGAQLSQALPIHVTTQHDVLNLSSSMSIDVNQPQAVAIADFNLDNVPDLAVFNAVDKSVLIYVGRSSGGLQYLSTTPLGRNAVAMVSGDFNEDGNIDLAVLCTDGALSVLLGDGSGSFSEGTAITTGNVGTAIVSADVNGDGHLDLMVLNATDSTVAEMLGTGTASFALQAKYASGVSPYGLVLSDFNQDNLVDFAIGNGDGTVSVYLNNPTGGFTAALSPATGMTAVAMIAADMNEDGNEDLLIANTDGTLSWLSGVGNGSFNVSTVAALNRGVVAVQVGDLNGDGHYDVVAVNPSAQTVQVLLGDGSGNMSAQSALSTTVAAQDLRLMDLNQDGREDVLLVQPSSNRIEVLQQSPQVVLSASLLDLGTTSVGLTTAAQNVVLTSNGPLPLIVSAITVLPGSNTASNDFVATNDCGALPVTLNPGAFCTIHVQFTPSITGAESANLSVIDNANGLEVANQAVSLAGTGLQIATQAAISTSTISFGQSAQVSVTISTAMGQPAGSVTLTANGNTWTQIVTAGTSVFTLPGLSAGNYAILATFTGGNGYASAMASGSLTVARLTPLLQWSQPMAIATATPLSVIQLNATANVSGSFVYQPGLGSSLGVGKNQTITASFTPTDAVDYNAATISTTITVTANPVPMVNPVVPSAVTLAYAVAGFNLNLTGAGFGPASVVKVNGTAVSSAAVGATLLSAIVPSSLITGAGIAQVKVVNPETSKGGVSNTVFLPITDPYNNLQFSLAGSRTLTLNKPGCFIVGDWNSDGNSDLAVLNTQDNLLEIYLGTSSGNLNLYITQTVSTNAVAISAGDFNEDGKMDLVVANATGIITILNGNGSGYFSNSGSFVSGSSVVDISVADLNLDGHLDLLVLNANASQATVWQGSGSGTFALSATLASGASVYGGVVADLNLDGYPDLAFGNGDGSVSIYLGSAAGSYGMISGIDASGLATALVSGDFNEDGIPDLAVVNTSGKIGIFVGQGNGSFSQTNILNVAGGTNKVSVGDFNGDGHLDLAVANQSSNSVVLLVGGGDGSFSASTSISTSAQPSSIATIDLNSDGRMDLVVGMSGANTIATYFQIPIASVSTSSLNFGKPFVGTASAVQTIVLTNSGSATLNISGITITPGSNAGNTDFSQSNNCGTMPAVLAPGATCSIGVMLTASSAMAEAATLTITDNQGLVAGGTQAIALSDDSATAFTTQTALTPGATVVYGNATNATVTVTSTQGTPTGNVNLIVDSNMPASMALTGGTAVFPLTGLSAGSHQLIARYASQGNYSASSAMGSVTIIKASPILNWTVPAAIASGTPLSTSQLNAASSVAGNYTYTPAAGTVLAIGNNQALSVQFTPTDTTDYNSASASNVVSVVALASPVSITPASLGFNAQIYNTYSNVQNVSIQNTGSTSIMLKTLALVSSGNSDTTYLYFSMVAAAGSCVKSVAMAPGASCVVQVRFKPLAIGAATGVLNVGYTVGTLTTQSIQAVSIAGTGVANPIPFVPPVLPSALLLSSATSGFSLFVPASGVNVNSVVSLNGKALVTVPSINNGVAGLQATVPASLITSESTGVITVANPKPTALVSNAGVVSFTNPLTTTNFSLGPFTANSISMPIAILAADVNGDRYPDIVVLDATDNIVATYINATSGRVALSSTVSIACSVAAVTTGDFNEDGKVDLAVACSNGQITVLLGAGNGTFTALSPISAGMSAQGIVAGDLNHDGHWDIAVANPTTNTVTVLYGIGTGSFNVGATLVTGPAPYGVALADFNLDGLLDLAIGNADGTVLIDVATTAGVYVTASMPSTGASAVAMVMGDFNEDGIADLAVLNTDNAVTILTGAGNGIFIRAASMTTGNGPQAITAGDMNGDGHLDLVVANKTDNTVSFLYGTGAATFASQAILGVATAPLALSAADMNNDGRFDLAVSSGGNNAFSVLMQTPLTSISVSNLSFGSMQYGQTSASQTFTVSNVGSGPLSVTSFLIHPGYNSQDFAMNTNCGTAPMTINPQTSCWVTVTYTPTRLGSEAATFQVVDNSNNVSNVAHYVTLTGTGLADPTSIVLTAPSVVTYGATVPVTVTVSSPESIPNGVATLAIGSNAVLTQRLSTSGAATFQVTGLQAGTYNFTVSYQAQYQYGSSSATGSLTVQPAMPIISWSAPADISQGTPLSSMQLNASASVVGGLVYSPPAGTVLSSGSQGLNVTFTPTDSANYAKATASTNLNVLENQTLFLSSTSENYGPVAVGNSSPAQSVLLMNHGTNSVTLNSLATNSNSFRLIAPTPTGSCLNLGGVLAPGVSCSIDILFVPQSVGPVTATLALANQPSGDVLTLSLMGAGVLNATPTILKLTPSSVALAIAQQGFSFRVLGAGFTANAVVALNGKNVPTTWVSATTLLAQVPASLYGTATTARVTVMNPGSGGVMTSNTLPLPINTSTAGVTLGPGSLAAIPVNTPQGISVGDLNGDGTADVAVIDNQDSEVMIYLGAGTSKFTLQTILNVAASPVSIAVGDFNEDGHIDMVVLSNSGISQIWYGDGSGNFGAGSSTSTAIAGNTISVGDFNGDGHTDIAVVNMAAQNVAILVGDGSGSFSYRFTLHTGIAPYGIAVADFNLDGIVDIAVGDADGTIGIFQGNGDATFTQVTTIETGATAAAIAASDFNEDGIPDLIVANQNITGSGTNGAVSVWAGQGNGLFNYSTIVSTGNAPDAFAIADFNGDGHMDFAVTSYYSNYLQIVLGSGAGGFTMLNPVSAGSRPVALGVADFDSDGRLDLIVADYASNSLLTLLQVPQASLSGAVLTFPAQSLGASSAPLSVTIANSGTATAPLVISNIAIAPAFNTTVGDFTQNNYCGALPASLAPGASCTINVRFSPSSVAAESAMLIITDNDSNIGGSMQQVALTGTTPLPTGVLATTQVNLTPTLTIPNNFLGLSFDWNTIESWMGTTSAGWDSTFQTLLSNLMAYNSGPLVLRVAGDSVATGTVSSTTVAPFGQLANNVNVHYILGLNLDLDTMSLTESQAQAYAAGIPNSSIDAFEIGNEPDNYITNGARGSNYGVQPYLADVSTYQQGVEAAVPALQRFAAPALAGSTWMSGLEAGVAAGQLPVNLVTQHSYITCNNKTTPSALDILLQPYATTSAPNLYGPYATIAHAAGAKFRMGEMNSICNGGQSGLSNNFTSALWSIDTMFAYVNAGIDGVNWHTASGSSYNAFNITATTKSSKNVFTLSQVNPLYYGLLLFAQATGNGAQMLPVTTLTVSNLDTWATIDSKGVVHLVIINKDESASGAVQFSVPGYSSGTVYPLTASSYTATTGVHFAGQTFDGSTDGTIKGTLSTQSVVSATGSFSITVPATSAVLVNLTQ